MLVIHLQPPEEVVCPLEKRDLRKDDDLRVGGGGSGIPGGRHLGKVSGNAAH